MLIRAAVFVRGSEGVGARGRRRMGGQAAFRGQWARQRAGREGYGSWERDENPAMMSSVVAGTEMAEGDAEVDARRSQQRRRIETVVDGARAVQVSVERELDGRGRGTSEKFCCRRRVLVYYAPASAQSASSRPQRRHTVICAANSSSHSSRRTPGPKLHRPASRSQRLGAVLHCSFNLQQSRPGRYSRTRHCTSSTLSAPSLGPSPVNTKEISEPVATLFPGPDLSCWPLLTSVSCLLVTKVSRKMFRWAQQQSVSPPSSTAIPARPGTFRSLYCVGLTVMQVGQCRRHPGTRVRPGSHPPRGQQPWRPRLHRAHQGAFEMEARRPDLCRDPDLLPPGRQWPLRLPAGHLQQHSVRHLPHPRSTPSDVQTAVCASPPSSTSRSGTPTTRSPLSGLVIRSTTTASTRTSSPSSPTASPSSSPTMALPTASNPPATMRAWSTSTSHAPPQASWVEPTAQPTTGPIPKPRGDPCDMPSGREPTSRAGSSPTVNRSISRVVACSAWPCRE